MVVIDKHWLEIIVSALKHYLKDCNESKLYSFKYRHSVEALLCVIDTDSAMKYKRETKGIYIPEKLKKGKIS